VELRIYIEYALLVYYGAGSPSTKIVRSILSRKNYILSMSKNTTLAKIPPVIHKSAPSGETWGIAAACTGHFLYNPVGIPLEP
jgi:hypothetical protein